MSQKLNEEEIKVDALLAAIRENESKGKYLQAVDARPKPSAAVGAVTSAEKAVGNEIKK